MIRVLLAEDHLLVRDGLKMLLNDQSDIKVIAEANNGKEVQNILSTQEIDLALLDINMPEMSGIETAEYITINFPTVKILMLSMHDNESFVNKSFHAGASGYILKNTGKEEFINAVKTVAAGNPYISHKISVDYIKKIQNPFIKTKVTVNLSAREIEILSFIAEGYTNGEIADKTFTSKRTIETHRKNLLEKTGAKNSAALIKFAIVNDLIKCD